MRDTVAETTVPSGGDRPGRVFYGWRVVAAAGLQGMFGNGAISTGFPRFFEPIRADFGISYAATSLVFSLARGDLVVSLVAHLVVGWLVDKFGSRPMILFAGLTAGIGLMLLAFVQEYWQLVFLITGVMWIGQTNSVSLMAAVNQWFVRRKAVALSTLLTAFAVSGSIVIPLLSWGITAIGWRPTVFISGLFIALLTLPVAYIVRSRPEDLGLLPDGDRPVAAAQPSSRVGEPERHDFTVRQALRTSAFRFLLAGVITRVSVTNAIVIQMFPLLTWKGLDDQTAAVAVAVMFFMAIPLRFLLGVSSVKLSPRKLLFYGMNLAAVGLVGLWLLPPWPGLAVFILGLAIAEGITSVNWIMLGDYFGRARFATLFGIMSFSHSSLMVVASTYAGWIRDTAGGYEIVLATFAPTLVLSGVMFALARRPRPPAGVTAVGNDAADERADKD